MEEVMFQAQFEHQSNSFGNFLSEETIQYHYGKHHKSYANNLNDLIKETHYCGLPLEQIIIRSRGIDLKVFNNAAQLFNHDFYWKCLTNVKTVPMNKLRKLIEKQFGSLDNLKREYIAYANTLFGSGWSWLILKNNELTFLNTTNAENPIGAQVIPLCVVDLWEHAYYIDYRNKRGEYIENIVKNCINWEFCESQI